MAEKLFSNQGGLYNRITQQIYLSPFTLGGVPYYLSLLDGQKSLAQNIDSLFFEKNARLQNEFEELYTTLFNDAEKYISIVELLAQNKKGVTREFIAEKIHLTGGILTKHLNNLERCDFIHCSISSSSRVIQNGITSSGPIPLTPQESTVGKGLPLNWFACSILTKQKKLLGFPVC